MLRGWSCLEGLSVKGWLRHLVAPTRACISDRSARRQRTLSGFMSFLWRSQATLPALKISYLYLLPLHLSVDKLQYGPLCGECTRRVPKKSRTSKINCAVATRTGFSAIRPACRRANNKSAEDLSSWSYSAGPLEASFHIFTFSSWRRVP